MPTHYIPFHTVRTCCREIARRTHPHQIPVALSWFRPETHGLVVLLEVPAK